VGGIDVDQIARGGNRTGNNEVATFLQRAPKGGARNGVQSSKITLAIPRTRAASDPSLVLPSPTRGLIGPLRNKKGLLESSPFLIALC
jgi:hypothetical protein